MNDMNKILVCTDYENENSPAITAAAQLASRSGAELYILHVVPQLDTHYDFLMKDLGEKLLHEAEARVEQVRAKLSFSPAPKITAIVQVGNPRTVITTVAAEKRVDLIVLDAEAFGERGTGRPSEITRYLVHTLPNDVLLVHNGFVGPFQSILIASDFSEGATAAMQRAVQLARLCATGSLAVCHSFEVPPRHYLAGVTEDEAREHCKQYAKKHFDEWIENIDTSGVTVEPVFVEGSASSAIAAEATRRGCDLVMVGSLGHTASSVILLGSVAQGLINKVPCSFWVERDEDHPITFGTTLAKLMGL